MSDKVKDKLLKQFSLLLEHGDALGKTNGDLDDYQPLEHVDQKLYVTWRARAVTLLSQVLPAKSPIRKELDKCLERGNGRRCFEDLYSLIVACRDDFEVGMFDDIVKRVEASVSVNYLEQAEQLMAEKEGVNHTYIAAAVLAGAVLEKSLRTICQRLPKPIALIKPGGKAKTLNPLIDDLRKVEYFNEIEAKQLRYWADVRNAAAHGRVEEFTSEQVALMLVGVRDFLARHMR